MTGNRLAEDRQNAESAAEAQRGENAAFRNPEHRLPGHLARGEHAGVREAGHDERGGLIVPSSDDVPDMGGDVIYMLLRLDAGRAVRIGDAFDLRDRLQDAADPGPHPWRRSPLRCCWD